MNVIPGPWHCSSASFSHSSLVPSHGIAHIGRFVTLCLQEYVALSVYFLKFPPRYLYTVCMFLGYVWNSPFRGQVLHNPTSSSKFDVHQSQEKQNCLDWNKTWAQWVCIMFYDVVWRDQPRGETRWRSHRGFFSRLIPTQEVEKHKSRSENEFIVITCWGTPVTITLNTHP